MQNTHATFAQNLQQAVAAVNLAGGLGGASTDDTITEFCNEYDENLYAYIMQLSDDQYILFTECVFALAQQNS
jgi:hypothetical protein